MRALLEDAFSEGQKAGLPTHEVLQLLKPYVAEVHLAPTSTSTSQLLSWWHRGLVCTRCLGLSACSWQRAGRRASASAAWAPVYTLQCCARLSTCRPGQQQLCCQLRRVTLCVSAWGMQVPTAARADA